MAHFELEKFIVTDQRGSVSYLGQDSTTEGKVSCDQKWLEANKAHKVTVEEGTQYLVPIEDNNFLV